MASKKEAKPPKLHFQLVSNIGLFWVCYHLSLLEWNVMPTSRNAKGVDLLVYSKDAKHKLCIQVMARQRPVKEGVQLGETLDDLIGDFLIVCHCVPKAVVPECFVLTTEEIRQLAVKDQGVKKPMEGKNPKVQYWLPKKKYETDQFREQWDRLRSGGCQTIQESAGGPQLTRRAGKTPN